MKKPIETPIEKPNEKPIDTPIEKPNEKPADAPKDLFPRVIEADLILPEGRKIKLTLERNLRLNHNVPVKVDGTLHEFMKEDDGVRRTRVTITT